MKNYFKKIKYFVELILIKPYYVIANLFLRDIYYRVVWDIKYNNFGDILTPYLLDNLTEAKIKRIGMSQYYPYTHYFIIGSILDRANDNTVVWGSGFIDEHCYLKNSPKKICAIRGPKTRNRLLEIGIHCPEVYGDPALLLPKIYSPKINKKYKLGIISHYIDKDLVSLLEIFKSEDILIIDIQVENPLTFIDEVLSCEKIASSSLHGLITADAYNIPSLWLEFSNNVKGNGFKFYDYFLSVGRKELPPLFVDNLTTLDSIYNSFVEYRINIDLNKLLNSCPFKLKQVCK